MVYFKVPGVQTSAFLFQAEDGIRDYKVTGVQTCALPISVVFGPGCRANATVARAIRLIAINAFDLHPQVFDQSTQGTPAKYTCCIAENEEESPWEPLHVERGFASEASTVAGMMIRSTAHIDN